MAIMCVAWLHCSDIDRWKGPNNYYHRDQLKTPKLSVWVCFWNKLKDRGYIWKLELWVMPMNRPLSSSWLVSWWTHKSIDVVVLLCWNKSLPLSVQQLDKLHGKLGLWSHLGAIDGSGSATLGLVSFFIMLICQRNWPAYSTPFCVSAAETLWCLTGELHYRPHSATPSHLMLSCQFTLSIRDSHSLCRLRWITFY